MSNEAPRSKNGERSTAQSMIGFWVGGAQSFSDAGPPPTNADWLQWFEHATTLRDEDLPLIERSVVSCYFWEKDNEHREKEEIDRSKFTAEQKAILESAEQTHQHYDTALTAGERYKRLDSTLKDKEFCFSPEGNPIVRLEAARDVKSILHSYMVSVKQKPYQSKYYTRLVGEYLKLLPKEGSNPAAQQD